MRQGVRAALRFQPGLNEADRLRTWPCLRVTEKLDVELVARVQRMLTISPPSLRNRTRRRHRVAPRAVWEAKDVVKVPTMRNHQRILRTRGR